MSTTQETLKRVGSKQPTLQREVTSPLGTDPHDTPGSVSFISLYRFTTTRERLLAAFGLLLAIVAGSLQPLMTLVFGSLTDAFTRYGALQQALTDTPDDDLLAMLAAAERDVRDRSRDSALYLLGIGIGMMLATYGYMFIWNYIGEINSKRLRESYLRSVLRQDIAYFDDVGAGEVATRIQTDCHLVQDGTSEKVAYVAQYLSTFITGFVIGIAKSWRLGLVLSSAILLIIGICIPWVMLADKWYVELLDQYAQAGSLAEEIIGSVRTIKAFASETILGDRFDQLMKRARRKGQLAAGSDGIGFPLIMWIVWSTYACAFFYGGLLTSWGIASSGDVITVIFSIMIAAFALGMTSDQLQAMGKATSAASKLFEAIDRVPPIDSASLAGLRPETIHGSISFENVSFHYPSRPEVSILKSFSMQVPPSQSVALVGASGSGKSTIVSLIERFYDPVGGIVRVDGHDIRDLNLKWLRQQIGIVSQEPTLFQTSVRGNVEHGLIGSRFEHASDDERFELVRNACASANAHDFIMALPNGYDTHVGDRGMLLSGGQKQRVAIARAIVSDPRILLLDEATSALDTLSEGMVEDALDRAGKGRTTITIAHRLSTIRDADKIVVMGAGEILEVGSHADLVANPNGAYSKLVAAQQLSEAKSSVQEAVAVSQAKVIAHSTTTLSDAPVQDISEPMTPGSEVLETPSEDSATIEAPSIWRVGARLAKLNKRDAWLYAVGMIGGIAHGAVYPALAILFGKTLQDFQIQDPDELRSALRGRATWYFVSAFAAAIVSSMQYLGTGVAGQNLSAHLRSLTLRATLRHDVAWFDEKNNSVGALTSNLSNHPQKVTGLFGVTLGTIIYAASTIAAGAIIVLGLIGVACLPLIASQGMIRLKVVAAKDEKTKKIHESSSHLAAEAASAVKTVAALTREDDVDRMFQIALEEPLRISIKTAVYSQALYAVSQGLLYPIMSLVFYVGSQWLLSGRYDTPQFFVVLIAVVFAANEASHMFSFVPDASRAKGAAAAIFKLVDYQPNIERHTETQNPCDEKAQAARTACIPEQPTQGRLVFDNVHFRYPSRPHVRVLQELNLTIEPGSFVALVGSSGCGKSTTIQMLERFYDPIAGTVSLDGHDIKQLDLEWYRSQIALVSQEPTLYSGSVRFNIMLGSNKPVEQVTEEELIKACKDANIYDFVTSLPDGLDTEVGGKGSQLSGGQKQRIAIARALIRNPKILLLDEATSALDSQSERVVQDALDQAAKGRTTIAIAHRLSTIRRADVIYCFKDGRVNEAGTHAELLALKGQYYELVQTQDIASHN